MDDGSFLPYIKDTYRSNPSLSQSVRHPTYDNKLTAACNPLDFEYVSVAHMPRLDLPEHPIQIKAIHAQIKWDTQQNVTIHWLGLQGGINISLPHEWVALNFDPQFNDVDLLILDKAQMCAQNAQDRFGIDQSDRLLVVPPGDSQDDDPPFVLQHNQCLSYYYQGSVVNCVMGGLVNAIYWWLGQELAD
jgi:hypothetical protein